MDKTRNNSRDWIYFLIFVLCILVAIVLIVIFFMQGSTKIDGSSEYDVTESVVCDGDNIVYPFFKNTDTEKKHIKINMLVNYKKLDAINLVYTLEYATKKEAEESRVSNHISLNKSYSEDNLEADSFGARFVDDDNEMQLTLYADAKSINGISAKYFLINGSHDMNIETLTKNYNDQGLNCIVTNES